jgi:aspartate ammonia-lyase
MVNQVCFQVFGCDATILAAAEAGQLELNVMMPVIAWNALHATQILREAMRAMQSRCVADLSVDEARCRELLDRSTALATALSPYIGYAATAEIAKESVRTGRPIRDLVRERRLLRDDQLDAILSAEAMTSPGIPGQTPAARIDDQTRTRGARAGGGKPRRDAANATRTSLRPKRSGTARRP